MCCQVNAVFKLLGVDICVCDLAVVEISVSLGLDHECMTPYYFNSLTLAPAKLAQFSLCSVRLSLSLTHTYTRMHPHTHAHMHVRMHVHARAHTHTLCLSLSPSFCSQCKRVWNTIL